MDRLRHRLAGLLDDGTPAGKIRQRRLARFMNKSEVWLSNVLSGKRGVRMVDLDKLAEFFHVPPSELIRDGNGELVEVTPTELKLLRKLRRIDPEYRDSILKIAEIRSAPTITARGKRRHEADDASGPPHPDE